MMGLAGLEFTSAMGNQFHSTPMARDSRALMRPNSRARFLSPAAPKAIAAGNAVAPSRRIDRPRSKSAAINRGYFESFCRRLVSAAASSGSLSISSGPSVATVTPKPPTWYFVISSRSSRYSGLSGFRNLTFAQTIIICPIFSSSVIFRRVAEAHRSPLRSR